MTKPELRDHKKFLRLMQSLKEPRPHVIGYLQCLWHRGYQNGDAEIGDAVDVEAAAEYPGDPGKLVNALLDSGFIDKTADGRFSIHDLFGNAPRYVQQRMERKGKRQKPRRTKQKAKETGQIDKANCPIDPDKFLAEWNAAVPFAPASSMPDKRIAALRLRASDPKWVESYQRALAKIIGSDFLKGGGKKGWVIDIDWFLHKDSVAYILEGKYDNGTEQRRLGRPDLPGINENDNRTQ